MRTTTKSKAPRGRAQARVKNWLRTAGGSSSLQSVTPSAADDFRSPVPSESLHALREDLEANEAGLGDASTLTLSNLRPDGARMIAEAKLMRFANRTKHRRYTIEFETPEFTCICPASGFPDFAHIKIRYVPRDWCVELKSLKLYFNQFRNQGIFHEDVSNRILDDLVELLDPWEMEVIGDFAVRGNIKTIIRAGHARGEKTGAKKARSKK